MVRFRVYFTRILGKTVILVLGIILINYFFFYHLGGRIGEGDLFFDSREEVRFFRDWSREMIVRSSMPEPIHYLYFLRGYVHGNYGITYLKDFPLFGKVLAEYLPTTIELLFFSLIIIFPCGVLLGILGATSKNRIIFSFLRFTEIFGISVPVFWLAIILQYMFVSQFDSMGLTNLPASGRFFPLLGPPNHITGLLILDSMLAGDWTRLLDALAHLLLPILTLSLFGIPIITGVVRRSLREIMNREYVKVAQSKGIGQTSIILRHCLRHIIIKKNRNMAPIFSLLILGILLTELIYDIPGVGLLTLYAFHTHAVDVYAFIGIILFFGFVYVSVNFLADLLRYFLDPRLKRDAAEVQKA